MWGVDHDLMLWICVWSCRRTQLYIIDSRRALSSFTGRWSLGMPCGGTQARLSAGGGGIGACDMLTNAGTHRLTLKRSL